MDTFYVRPEIMQNHAKELLSVKSGPLGRKKKILSVETLYVPGYVFTLNVKEKNLVQTIDVFVDAVTGDFGFIRHVQYEKKELCGLWEDTARLSREEAEIIARDNFAR